MYIGLRLVIYFKNFIKARLNMYIGLRLVKITEKIELMIIAQNYIEVQHILYVILDTAHKEIYLL